VVSPDTPVSSNNKTDCQDISEILKESAVKHLKVNPNPNSNGIVNDNSNQKYALSSDNRFNKVIEVGRI